MPFQQVFELKDVGLTHGSQIVDQSIDLGLKGVPGSLGQELFPSSLDIRSSSVQVEELLLEGGTASRPALSFRVDTNTGLYRFGVNELAFATDGEGRWYIANGGDFRAIAGNTGEARLQTSESLSPGADRPPFTFEDDPDTGLYRSGVNELAFATDGVGWWYIASGGNFRAIAGNTGEAQLQTHESLSPGADRPPFTFENDTDTGIYRKGADALGFTTGGEGRWYISSGGDFRPQTSLSGAPRLRHENSYDQTLPAFTFEGDIDSGFYRAEANRVAVTAGGSAQMSWEASVVRIHRNSHTIRWFGTSGPHGLEMIGGGSEGSPESALYYRTTPNAWSFENSSGTNILEIDIDGNFVDANNLRINGTSHGSASGSHVTNGNSHNHAGGDGGTINHGNLSGLGDIDDHTWAIIDGGSTTASANTWFGGARSIKVVSSQLKNKTSISPLLVSDEHPHMVPPEKRTERRYPFSVLDITPIQFKSVLDGDDSRIVRTGFLWEDVQENYPAGTQDESLDVNALMAGILTEVKQLRQEVDELKAQLEAQ